MNLEPSENTSIYGFKYFFNEIIINDYLYVSFADNDKGYFKYIDTKPIEFENHVIYKVKRYNNGQFEEKA